MFLFMCRYDEMCEFWCHNGEEETLEIKENETIYTWDEFEDRNFIREFIWIILYKWEFSLDIWIRKWGTKIVNNMYKNENIKCKMHKLLCIEVALLDVYENIYMKKYCSWCRGRK